VEHHPFVVLLTQLGAILIVHVVLLLIFRRKQTPVRRLFGQAIVVGNFLFLAVAFLLAYVLPKPIRAYGLMAYLILVSVPLIFYLHKRKKRAVGNRDPRV
jgi:uncharacterized membrane protein